MMSYNFWGVILGPKWGYNLHERFQEETEMKKHIFGLGIMFVGAVLMFVFMSSEVYGASILPPFVPEVRWESLLMIYAVVITFLVLVTVVVTSVVKKMQLSKVLRIGES